jgi:hypothetical protein
VCVSKSCSPWEKRCRAAAGPRVVGAKPTADQGSERGVGRSWASESVGEGDAEGWGGGLRNESEGQRAECVVLGGNEVDVAMVEQQQCFPLAAHKVRCKSELRA